MMLGWSVMDPTIWSDVFLTDGQTELQSECSAEVHNRVERCRVYVLCRVGDRSGTVNHGQVLSRPAYGSGSNSA